MYIYIYRHTYTYVYVYTYTYTHIYIYIFGYIEISDIFQELLSLRWTSLRQDRNCDVRRVRAGGSRAPAARQPGARTCHDSTDDYGDIHVYNGYLREIQHGIT